jgi:hypothetical protein
MNAKTILFLVTSLSIEIALIVSSLTGSIIGKPVFATLLEKNTLTDQNKIGNLLTPNDTNTDQTNQLDNVLLQNQSDELDRAKSDVANQQKAGPIIQGIKDSQLADRIFPLIIAKIDGFTILKKMDGQELLRKILPYVDVKVEVTQPRGNYVSYRTDEDGGKSYTSADAKCSEEDGVLVGGGFSSDIAANDNARGVFYKDKDLWHVQIPPGPPNRGGSVTAFAECIKVELGIKPPESAPSVILPPGGGPLVPPE